MPGMRKYAVSFWDNSNSKVIDHNRNVFSGWNGSSGTPCVHGFFSQKYVYDTRKGVFVRRGEANVPKVQYWPALRCVDTVAWAASSALRGHRGMGVGLEERARCSCESVAGAICDASQHTPVGSDGLPAGLGNKNN